MSCVLTSGRIEPCRDNIGGIKNVYLFPFVEYSYTQIEGVRGVEITSFPSSDIYKYEVQGGTFSENITNDEFGIKYEQNLNVILTKQDLITTNELNAVQKLDLRYIVEYNNGKFRMGGVYNGARLTSYSIDSGGEKSSFNGYNLTFTGVEEYSAPFIDNINTVGFFILLEDSFFMLLESGGKIAIE